MHVNLRNIRILTAACTYRRKEGGRKKEMVKREHRIKQGKAYILYTSLWTELNSLGVRIRRGKADGDGGVGDGASLSI